MYRLANCMLITSSMCPIQLFQTRFQLHWTHKNFNSCCKEEHLKGNRDWNVLCTFYHGPRFTVTSLIQQLSLKKMFEGVWDSDFEQSDQVKLAKFLCFTPTMVVYRGSLNSWNQWINDQPFNQSLFRPLYLCESICINWRNICCGTQFYKLCSITTTAHSVAITSKFSRVYHEKQSLGFLFLDKFSAVRWKLQYYYSIASSVSIHAHFFKIRIL